MEAAVALREQPEIRELFEVLEGNGLKKERQEVESLVDYLEGMESQFGEVIKELKEVRGQLEQIQALKRQTAVGLFCRGRISAQYPVR